jgi:hypothetical protein
MERSRSFNFIVNNFTQEDLDECKNIALKYSITFMVTAINDKTLKIYLHFKNPMRFSTITKLIQNCVKATSYADATANYKRM